MSSLSLLSCALVLSRSAKVVECSSCLVLISFVRFAFDCLVFCRSCCATRRRLLTQQTHDVYITLCFGCNLVMSGYNV